MDRLIGFQVDPSLNGYKPDRAKAFFRQLTDNVATIPGVESVGLAAVRILEGNEWDNSATAEGYTPARPGEHPEPFMNSISPGYFATLSVPVVAGREFTLEDTQEVLHREPDDWVPTTIVINETFAKRYFAGKNPLGMHIGFGSDPGVKLDMEVIGVVKDIKYTGLRDEVPEQAFLPYLARRYTTGMTVYVRTTLEPDALYSSLRTKVKELDPNLPIYKLRTTNEQLDQSLTNERMIANLSAAVGFLATLLAMIGLYGVMAYTVSRRTREIGIRMALGAINRDVVWMVMREVLLLVVIGVAVGIPATLLLTPLVKSQLFGLPPHDPATLTLTALSLAAVGCLAGYVPALRASRVVPIRALRHE